MSGESELDYRRSLLCTRQKCEDTCYDVNNDGGSLVNQVLEKIVTKLNLKRKKHPHLYCISWVQDDQKVMVNEQYLVKFNTKRHQDEVVYDIIPLDIYHMFLSRLC